MEFFAVWRPSFLACKFFIVQHENCDFRICCVFLSNCFDYNYKFLKTTNFTYNKMYQVLSPVKDLIKLDAIWIDNNVFRLHYKVTAIILVTASLLVTSKQYIGDPIDCIVDGVPQSESKLILHSINVSINIAFNYQ